MVLRGRVDALRLVELGGHVGARVLVVEEDVDPVPRGPGGARLLLMLRDEAGHLAEEAHGSGVGDDDGGGLRRKERAVVRVLLGAKFEPAAPLALEEGGNIMRCHFGVLVRDCKRISQRLYQPAKMIESKGAQCAPISY